MMGDERDDELLLLPEGLIDSILSGEESSDRPLTPEPRPVSPNRAMDRLAKILAKAENTDSPEEAQVYLDAALQRAALLGVNLEMARAHARNKTKRETPEERRFTVGDLSSRYNAYLVQLFTDIAYVHDVRCTIGGKNVYVWGYGLPSDLAIVEALFGVASIQMVNDATAALRRGEQRKVGGGYMRRNPNTGYYDWVSGVDGRIYRASFYKGYIERLNTRLWNARNRAVRQTDQREQEAGRSGGTELVLRTKKQEVDDFYDQKHAHLKLKDFKNPLEKEPDNYAGALNAESHGASSAQVTDISLAMKVGAQKREALSG